MWYKKAMRHAHCAIVVHVFVGCIHFGPSSRLSRHVAWWAPHPVARRADSGPNVVERSSLSR